MLFIGIAIYTGLSVLLILGFCAAAAATRQREGNPDFELRRGSAIPSSTGLGRRQSVV